MLLNYCYVSINKEHISIILKVVKIVEIIIFISITITIVLIKGLFSPPLLHPSSESTPLEF